MPQLKATDLAREYGFTSRHWIRLAAEGRIPGARQPAGQRGQWLFDQAMFLKWWRGQERVPVEWTPRRPSSMITPSVTVESTAEACRRRTERLLNAVLGNGSPTPKPSRRRNRQRP